MLILYKYRKAGLSRATLNKYPFLTEIFSGFPDMNNHLIILRLSAFECNFYLKPHPGCVLIFWNHQYNLVWDFTLICKFEDLLYAEEFNFWYFVVVFRFRSTFYKWFRRFYYLSVNFGLDLTSECGEFSCLVLIAPLWSKVCADTSFLKYVLTYSKTPLRQ